MKIFLKMFSIFNRLKEECSLEKGCRKLWEETSSDVNESGWKKEGLQENYSVMIELTSTLNWIKKIIKTVKNHFSPISDQNKTLSLTIQENDEDKK